MTNESIPQLEVKGSVIIIKNSMNTGLLTTTELDGFLSGLTDEGLDLFFQEVPPKQRDFVPGMAGDPPQRGRPL